jgi:ubiquinone/menaquinone biosynthesis C-methylase UbiE
MRVLESAPHRYDWGLNIISMGNIRRIEQSIADRFIAEGDEVLDVGCGTGTLAVMMTTKGARVKGMDHSKHMLAIAEKKIKSSPHAAGMELLPLGIAEMDTAFAAESFDKVTSTLVFSELSEDEQRFTLRQCRRLLKKEGLLIIADETAPEGRLSRFFQTVLKLPLVIITYVLTQTVTHSVKGLADKIIAAGFDIQSDRRFFGGSFQLIVARPKAGFP